MFPRLRTLTPQLLLWDGVQRRGCSSASTPPHSSGGASAASSSGAAEKKTAPKRSNLRVDWTPGPEYYFGPDEAERFLIPANVGLVSSRKDSAMPGKAATGAEGGESGGTAEAAPPRQLVRIAAPLSTYVIDTSIPPLRPEEVERWRLEGDIYHAACMLWRGLPNTKPNYLLPPEAMVTYLGDDMHKIDQLYRRSGLYTPSEVAEALFPYVPTFPVEVRHIFAALPPQLIRKVEQDFGSHHTVTVLFERFKMLFNVSMERFSYSIVSLNSRFWFVRQHPSYGKADRMMRKHRLGGRVSMSSADTVTLRSGATARVLAMVDNDDSGSVSAAAPSPTRSIPHSTNLFQALVRNLPRCPAPKPVGDAPAAAASDLYARTRMLPYMQQRYEPRNFLQWIASFPASDAAVLKGVSELEVIRALCKYTHVFQLMSRTAGEPNIFVEGAVLLAAREARQNARTAASASHGGGAPAEGDDGDADDVTSAEGWDGDEMLEKAASEPATATADDEQRVAAFKQAIADDMIGMDDILAASQSAPPAATDAESSETSAKANDADEEADAQGGFFWDDEKGSAVRVDPDAAEAEGAENGAGFNAPNGGNAQAANHRYRGPLPPGVQVDELTAFGLPLEEIYVRRLPPDIAPRSLSDWDEHTSPDVMLAALAARFLAPPPTTAKANPMGNFFTVSARRCNPAAPALGVWRWVAVDRLYNGYTVEQRRYLRREYKGLVNFLRYHGKLFELSSDLMYVIAHDPEGALSPFPISERRFSAAERTVLPRTFDDNAGETASMVGEAERAMFERNLSNYVVPRCRRDILLLDPGNPLLQADVFQEEVANILPPYPVPLQQVLLRAPPLLRAALPYRLNLNASKSIMQSHERGLLMVQRREDYDRSRQLGSETAPLSVEDAIAEVLELQLGDDGVSVKALQFMHLSAAAVNTLCDHYGSLMRAIAAFPQYFEVCTREVRGRKYNFVRFRR